MKTEHAGAKKGGTGFYGHHADAKSECRSLRRRNDKDAVTEQQEDRVGESPDEDVKGSK